MASRPYERELQQGHIRGSQAAAMLAISQERLYLLIAHGWVPGGVLINPDRTQEGRRRTYSSVPKGWVDRTLREPGLTPLNVSLQNVGWAPGHEPVQLQPSPPPPAPSLPLVPAASPLPPELQQLVTLLQNSQPAFVGLREVQAMLKAIQPLYTEVFALRKALDVFQREFGEMRLLFMEQATTPRGARTQ